jgi:hypothetical protein
VTLQAATPEIQARQSTTMPDLWAMASVHNRTGYRRMQRQVWLFLRAPGLCLLARRMAGAVIHAGNGHRARQSGSGVRPCCITLLPRCCRGQLNRQMGTRACGFPVLTFLQTVLVVKYVIHSVHTIVKICLHETTVA